MRAHYLQNFFTRENIIRISELLEKLVWNVRQITLLISHSEITGTFSSTHAIFIHAKSALDCLIILSYYIEQSEELYINVYFPAYF